MAAVIIAITITVITNIEGCLYYKVYLGESLQRATKWGWGSPRLLWAWSKGDMLSDRKVCLRVKKAREEL